MFFRRFNLPASAPRVPRLVNQVGPAFTIVTGSQAEASASSITFCQNGLQGPSIKSGRTPCSHPILALTEHSSSQSWISRSRLGANFSMDSGAVTSRVLISSTQIPYP